MRIVSDEEADTFPATEMPEPPTEDTRERWYNQVIEEDIDEHPAFKTVVPEE